MSDRTSTTGIATTHTDRQVSLGKLVAGFAAGALAVPLFHQTVLALLASIGFINATAYSLEPAAVTGIPQVVSTSFWGGVWGVIFAILQTKFPRGVGYWLTAILFGAIFPTAVYYSLVAYLKSQPLAAGGDVHHLAAGLAVNAAWGLGTALAFRAVYRS